MNLIKFVLCHCIKIPSWKCLKMNSFLCFVNIISVSSLSKLMGHARLSLLLFSLVSRAHFFSWYRSFQIEIRATVYEAIKTGLSNWSFSIRVQNLFGKISCKYPKLPQWKAIKVVLLMFSYPQRPANKLSFRRGRRHKTIPSLIFL